MNALKHRYTIKFETGSQDYSIYDGDTVAYKGYDSYREAEHDMEKLVDQEEDATPSDFETFFKDIAKQLADA